MEEIRTSEKIEQEILEDARKKAERILKGLEKTLNEMEAEWKAKRESFAEKGKEELERRKNALRQEVSASIPLEKKRIELKVLNEKFESFLRQFFHDLSDEELRRIIQSRLGKVAPFFEGSSLRVFCRGLKDVEGLVLSNLSNARVLSVQETESSRGIRLQTEDGTYTFRLTVEELEQEVREAYRGELFDALFSLT